MSSITFSGSEIILKHIQIKSLKKARLLAKHLDKIEKNCGIQSVAFVLENSFICNDIKLYKLNKTPAERTLRKLLKDYCRKTKQ